MKKLLLLATLFLLVVSCNRPKPYFSIAGEAEGTTYSLTYSDVEQRNFKPSIDSLLQVFESSLSVYNEESIISKVNRNEEVELDSFFITVFNCSKKVSAMSGGAFDISGAPLFSAWKFGPNEGGERHVPSAHVIGSLRQLVGMDKLQLVGRKLIKSDPRMSLNMNAVAKGYSADVVAAFLDSKGIEDYVVEIGGEMRLKGANADGLKWKIGIDKPLDGDYAPGEHLQTTIRITGKGIATSGNYRQFFVENGKKYAHTIDPRTGYPVLRSLLSATVVADDCMTADAVATALMVMGIDGSRTFLAQHPELDAYLIYSSADTMVVFATPRMLNEYVSE